MSYLSIERMAEYGGLVEEKVRLQSRQSQLSDLARKDFRFRMQVESWIDADLKAIVLGRLDERVEERMDENRSIALALATNREARKKWHQDALSHVHSIICPVCSRQQSAATNPPNQS